MSAKVVIKNRLFRNKLLAMSASVAALTLAMALNVPVYADTPPKQVSIEAQPLGDAIFDLSQQTGATIFVNDRLVRGKMAKALNGTYTVEQGMSELLRGSGLTYRANGDGAYALVQRVAQVEETDRPELREEEPAIEVDEIIVTGTNIRGVYPASSPLIIFDKESIDKTGFATVPDLVQSLPQNFITASSTTPLVGAGDRNPRFNSSVNLRGLGADATLNLLNGRRIAPSNGGSAVDVSIIPLSAIERVEIVTDGASAIYGTDAVAGVINFVLRDDFDGVETSVRYGAVTDGNLDEIRVNQTIGKAWNSGSFVIAYEYFNQDNLLNADRAFAASCDLTPLGGANGCPDPSTGAFNSGTQPGTITGGAGVFTVPSGQDGTSLTFDRLIPGVVDRPNARENGDIIPASERHSVFAGAYQDISTNAEVFVEGGYTNRQTDGRFYPESRRFFVPVSNAFLSQDLANGVEGAPGATRVRVNYSFDEEFGLTANASEVQSYFVNSGIKFDLTDRWRGEISAQFAKTIESGGVFDINTSLLNDALASSDPATAFNPFGDGTGTSQAVLDTLLDRTFSEFDTDVLTFGGKADGPLFSIPGGDVKFAIGAEYREETLTSIATRTNPFGVVSNTGGDSFDRNITAVFGEVFVPLVDDENRMPGISRFEISAGVRFESYSDFGETTNPKIGVVWTPISGLDLRGTYGTSFQAPLLEELDTSFNGFFIFELTDPNSPTGRTNSGIFFGGSDTLQPESATTWTAGFDYTPVFLSNMTLNFTYFDVDFEDRITSGAPSATRALADPITFGSQIIPRPTDPAQQAAFDAEIEAGRNLPRFGGDFSGGLPVLLIVDQRLQNLAKTEIAGMDIVLSYNQTTNYGDLSFGLNAAILTKFDEFVTEAAEANDVLDTIFNPNDFRLRGNVGWSYRDLGASLFVNYASGYDDNQLGDDQITSVDSWTTVDMSVDYNLNGLFDANLLSDTSVRISVQNIFDEDPPFVNLAGGQGQFAFDPTQASPLGRFVAFEIRKVW